MVRTTCTLFWCNHITISHSHNYDTFAKNISLSLHNVHPARKYSNILHRPCSMWANIMSLYKNTSHSQPSLYTDMLQQNSILGDFEILENKLSVEMPNLLPYHIYSPSDITMLFATLGKQAWYSLCQYSLCQAMPLKIHINTKIERINFVS